MAKLVDTFSCIKEGKSVADIACGTGEFLKYIANKHDKLSLYGCDINKELCEQAKDNLSSVSKNLTIECRDAFSLINNFKIEPSLNLEYEDAPDCDSEEAALARTARLEVTRTPEEPSSHLAPSLSEDEKFDLVFVQPPFTQKTKITPDIQCFLEEILHEEVPCVKTISADLLFALLATQLIKETGCAFAVLSSSSCSNVFGKTLRKCLVEAGYLEMVIPFPPKMLEQTSIPITVLLLSKEENLPVRMFNTTGFNTKEGREALYTGPGITQLYLAYDTFSRDVFSVDKKDLTKTSYDLCPEKYFGPPYSYKYAVPLSEVSLVLKRGVVHGNKSRNPLASNKQNARSVYFARARNIEDGIFYGPLDKIEEELVPNKRIALETGDILLSKTGTPFKCAVVDDLPSKETYFQEHLYLIRVDKSRLDPYFLCAFLTSIEGQKCLNSIMVGGVINTLTVKNLKEMHVPLPRLEKQQEIASFFAEQIQKIKKLKSDFEASQEKIKEVLDETKWELYYEHF